MRVGLVHTVPDLTGSFDAMARAALPDAEVVHIADAWLLAEAIRAGVGPDVEARVTRWCRDLAEAGCAAVLVTCSSIGEAAEAADRELSIPVARIDAPMAREAVAAAQGEGRTGRIVVLATQPSTLGPTSRLVEREIAAELQRAQATASATGAGLTSVARLCEGAAAARAGGDRARHDAIVAEYIRACDPGDVIVLAQASMADAVPSDAPCPVLSSPHSGMAAFAALV